MHNEPVKAISTVDLIAELLDRLTTKPTNDEVILTSLTCESVGAVRKTFDAGAKAGPEHGGFAAWKGSKGQGWCAKRSDVIAWLSARTKRERPKAPKPDVYAAALAGMRRRRK